MELLQAERAFTPYGPSHWALIGLILAGSVVLALLGRRSSAVASVRLGRGFALVLVAFLVPMLVYRHLPPQWDIEESLPLHLCDLAWMVAAYALWSRKQRPYALTYYWGLTLTPQAMITPALDAPDFPHLDFVDFWGQHLLVVWAAAYLTWGARMRPGWRDYSISVVITLGWAGATLVFNGWAGSNYGFLNSKPQNPSLLDLMGGWPWYLVVELVVGLAAWALVTWPWTRRQGSAEPARFPHA